MEKYIVSARKYRPATFATVGGILKMLDHVSDGDAAEIINLASRQYGGDYLVLRIDYRES